jgi:hypothetical protein
MASAVSPVPTRPPPATGRPEKLRLGDVLVQQRLISQEQLQQTLALQRQTGKKVGRLLIESGVITEELLANGLARQLHIPFVNLKTFPFRADVVKLLPESAARRFRALVLQDKGDSLLVALGDPLDLFAFDELTRLLKRSITIAAVRRLTASIAAPKRSAAWPARWKKTSATRSISANSALRSVLRARRWCACCNRCLKTRCRSAPPIFTSSRKKVGCKSGSGLTASCKPRPWPTNALAARWRNGSS